MKVDLPPFEFKGKKGDSWAFMLSFKIFLLFIYVTSLLETTQTKEMILYMVFTTGLYQVVNYLTILISIWPRMHLSVSRLNFRPQRHRLTLSFNALTMPLQSGYATI